MSGPQIILITGERQTGKSTLCQSVTRRLRETGVQLSGLLTSRTGPHDLEVTEIHTGDRYTLTLPFGERAGILLAHFNMNPQALTRGVRALRSSFPTQVFVLDELGPLELKLGRGWVEALDLLQKPTYRVAVVVIRPELLLSVIKRLSAAWYTIVYVTPENRNSLPDELYAQVLSLTGLQQDLK